MPFKSKAQARAAFGGYLGKEMQQKAPEFEDATPGGIKSLPTHVKNTSGILGSRTNAPAKVGTAGLGATRHRLSTPRKDSMRHIKKGK